MFTQSNLASSSRKWKNLWVLGRARLGLYLWFARMSLFWHVWRWIATRSVRPLEKSKWTMKWQLCSRKMNSWQDWNQSNLDSSTSSRAVKDWWDFSWESHYFECLKWFIFACFNCSIDCVVARKFITCMKYTLFLLDEWATFLKRVWWVLQIFKILSWKQTYRVTSKITHLSSIWIHLKIRILLRWAVLEVTRYRF
jgi:hypothetical protein